MQRRIQLKRPSKWQLDRQMDAFIEKLAELTDIPAEILKQKRRSEKRKKQRNNQDRKNRQQHQKDTEQQQQNQNTNRTVNDKTGEQKLDDNYSLNASTPERMTIPEFEQLTIGGRVSERHRQAKKEQYTKENDAATTVQRSNQTSLKEEGTTNTGKPKACEVLTDHCPGITHEHKSPKFSTDTLRSFVSSALVQPNSDRHEREQRKDGRESVSSLQGDYIEDSYEHNGNKTTATEAAGDTEKTAAIAGTAQVAEDSHTEDDDSG